MLYGTGDISLQQLAVTFRRGDLIEILNRLDVSEMREGIEIRWNNLDHSVWKLFRKEYCNQF